MTTIDTILHTIAAEENTTDEAVRAEIRSCLLALQEQDPQLRDVLTALQPDNGSVETLVIALLAAALSSPADSDIDMSARHSTQKARKTGCCT